MDQSIAWQKVVQDLAGNNQEIREQLREITGWFPNIEMMRNDARGLIKESVLLKGTQQISKNQLVTLLVTMHM
ncbi:hypothetical protein ZWY2020_036624 [Hordeum vulgare]|nr:hypothetical protein ZWY2020_036624 [Hordeum vulgare]